MLSLSVCYAILLHFCYMVVAPPVQLSLSDCTVSDCLNGECFQVTNSSWQCFCRNGYTGYSCETDFDDCSSQPCQHGATCMDGVAHVTCICPQNFSGPFCETDERVCYSEPCLNGGICKAGEDGFECICLSGYSGTTCETDENVCTSSTCLNGGVCIEGPGDNYTCSCSPGFEGKNCELDFDECLSQPCLNGGICFNRNNSFKCACPKDWRGTVCEERVELCTENPCLNGGMCEKKDNLTICYCKPDFHGELCEKQYDECQPHPRCFNGGTCRDGVNQFFCDCQQGFTGYLCEHNLHNITTTNSSTDPTIDDSSSPSTENTNNPIFPPTRPSYCPPCPTIPPSSRPVRRCTCAPSSQFRDGFVETNILQNTIRPPLTTSLPFTSLPSMETTLIDDPLEPTTEMMIPRDAVEHSLQAKCDETHCYNGGTCVKSNLTSIEKCHCPYPFEGPFCELLSNISVPFFSRTSYLQYQFPPISASTGIHIAIWMYAKECDGILFYAESADHVSFFLVYLARCTFRLLFSCGSSGRVGLDTMKVGNSSFPVEVFLDVEWLSSDDKNMSCQVSLGINSSFVLSGQQHGLSSYPNLTQFYLGGIPGDLITAASNWLPNFYGCINGLWVNGKSYRLMEDTIKGFQVGQCETPQCLKQDCRNTTDCEDLKCRCPSGWFGPKCSERINPCDSPTSCSLDSTCVPFLNSYRCVCRPGAQCRDNMTHNIPVTN